MNCKHKKKRYNVVFATIDKTPYAGSEWFRVGMDDKDCATFKDAMNLVITRSEMQVLAHAYAECGRKPTLRELNAVRCKMIERPTDSTVMVKIPNMTTLYKVCGREVAQ